MGLVSSGDIRAVSGRPPQQASVADVLARRVRGLRRERATGRRQPAPHQTHRVQLHTVSTNAVCNCHFRRLGHEYLSIQR